MCIVSSRSAGLTAENLIDRMLAKGVRLKTSTPIVDPSGDYAWSIFDRIDALRPGSGAVLKDRAQALMKVTAAPGRADPACATPARSASRLWNGYLVQEAAGATTGLVSSVGEGAGDYRQGRSGPPCGPSRDLGGE